MPIYEFRCDCGHRFGIERPITKHPKSAECPLCGTATRKRVYSISTRRRDGHSTAAEVEAEVASSPTGQVPNATLTDCRIDSCGTGVKIGRGTYVKSRGLRITNTRVGIDNAGRFDGPDTKFE